MKKIIISLSVVAAVAAAVVVGTTAFFSDTETSVGNTFTAGEIDLKVDSECHYNGNVCKKWDPDGGGQLPEGYYWFGQNPYPVPGTPCSCTWISKDLTTGDVFFNFSDVKPGDEGESTLSFELKSNPAWACAYVSEVVDTDNTCVEPEIGVEGQNCVENGINNGELDENLLITVWIDSGVQGNNGLVGKCDNVYQTGEPKIVNNKPLSQYLTAGVIPIADKNHQPALQPGKYCVGIAWELPANTGNAVQTDKVGADLSFYVVQERNNPNFVCGQVQ